jgi:hypothetical protein
MLFGAPSEILFASPFHDLEKLYEELHPDLPVLLGLDGELEAGIQDVDPARRQKGKTSAVMRDYRGVFHTHSIGIDRRQWSARLLPGRASAACQAAWALAK